MSAPDAPPTAKGLPSVRLLAVSELGGMGISSAAYRTWTAELAKAAAARSWTAISSRGMKGQEAGSPVLTPTNLTRRSGGRCSESRRRSAAR